MEVKPYQQEGSKKQQVTEMFDNIAGKYDLLNRVLSLGIDTIWRKKAISKIADLQPKQILDVATGTADVAIEMAKRLQPDKIIGLDISKEMLAVGQTKIENKKIDHIIELTQGDSENLPFEDNSFDAITVAFGVRNFENLEKGMREMNRVLRPGGRLVVLEFSKPSMFPLKQGYNFYFKNILPNIGKLTSKDPKAYTYLYESVQAFPDGENFLAVMRKTGYKNEQQQQLTAGICSIYVGDK
ncbi:MAG: bifunctional demethylmenaquinone methyltransferase/2-methoxy-6-polyprenyl-1,4-benzoquinol methylase UbiE [Saprospiraceae bacterium]